MISSCKHNQDASIHLFRHARLTRQTPQSPPYVDAVKIMHAGLLRSRSKVLFGSWYHVRRNRTDTLVCEEASSTGVAAKKLNGRIANPLPCNPPKDVYYLFRDLFGHFKVLQKGAATIASY